MTRPSSEDATSEHSYQTSVTASLPNDQYLLAQQPYYQQPPTPSHEFYQQQNIQMGHVAVPEPAPIVTQNVQVPSPIDLQHAQQQYMQLMQQRYDQSRQGYLPPEYHQPQFAGHPLAEGHPLMVSYNPGFSYKAPARILNQPEGTDWGFLGVG